MRLPVARTDAAALRALRDPALPLPRVRAPSADQHTAAGVSDVSGAHARRVVGDRGVPQDQFPLLVSVRVRRRLWRIQLWLRPGTMAGDPAGVSAADERLQRAG